MRLIHYLNAFFGGVGGRSGGSLRGAGMRRPAWPGQFVATVVRRTSGCRRDGGVCGDGYFSEHEELVVERVLQYLRDQAADVFVAGPAFGSGRYGLACGRLCAEAERLGIPAVTGLHEENPGGDVFLPRHIFAVTTTASAAGMRQALEGMTALALKRARREALGSAAEEGFLPRDVRRTVETGVPAAKRAVDLALRKWEGAVATPAKSRSRRSNRCCLRRPFPTPARRSSPWSPSADWCPRAILTGSPPPGAAHWGSYDIAGMSSLAHGDWEIVHGGYDNTRSASGPEPRRPLSTPCGPCSASDASAACWTTCW